MKKNKKSGEPKRTRNVDVIIKEFIKRSRELEKQEKKFRLQVMADYKR
jgi:hypothetical protein